MSSLSITNQKTIYDIQKCSFTITIFYGFFSSFSAALVLTTYHLKPMLTAACTNLFKSIEMTPMIKSFRQICMYLHNFISFSFFFFNFQIHSTTGKNYLQQNSISTSTQWSCKHDHFLFSLVIAQKIEHTYKIAPN